jgi:deazaflavin-dependent oxidoreductase (nitroreductase family)
MRKTPPPRPDFLDSPVLPKIMKLMSRANVWVYRKTNGGIGGTWRVGSAFPRGVPVCLLTTRGRKSGEPRTTPLLFLADGDEVVVVGSQGGLPKHPQWFLNLEQEPRVEVQIGGEIREMRARVAPPEERALLWPRLVALYRDFEAYQSWTDRAIPVVVCEPGQQLGS